MKMNKFNNQYDLIFHLHNEVLDFMYGQKTLEKENRNKEDIIKKLQQENYKLMEKIEELKNKECESYEK